ncbi:MAG: DNA recombination protein RmuC, partial [Bacteroidota bacterium]|nr:DNA recombination protein RmuC [Bacteroidota bacterium]
MLSTINILIAAGGIVVAIVIWLITRGAYNSKLSVANEKVLQDEHLIAQLTNNCNELQVHKENLLQQSAKTEGLLQSLTEQCNGLKKYQRDNEILNNQLILYKTKFHAAEEKLEVQKAELEMIGSQFTHQFKTLAQEILDEKSAKFTALNEEKMNALITPLKAQLGEFKQKVEETYDRESKERFSLGKEVQRLIEMSQKVSDEANNLTTALKGNVKMQGNWGEMILESLLESSGLSKG